MRADPPDDAPDQPGPLAPQAHPPAARPPPDLVATRSDGSRVSIHPPEPGMIFARFTLEGSGGLSNREMIAVRQAAAFLSSAERASAVYTLRMAGWHTAAPDDDPMIGSIGKRRRSNQS